MFDPVSTYRIQFHRDFTFKRLKNIIPYLHKLGIKTLYASPIFEATPGSTHGYDVVSSLNINPEIGTLEELRSISTILKKSGISWLQDIVPNHMAYHPNNKWLMDVLENGKASEYASYFDIAWDSQVYNGRIMVPFLGVPFEEAIKQKQLQLVIKEGKLWFDYFGQRYPVRLKSPNDYSAAYLKKVNNDPALLKDISDKQAYQLCHWQETDKQINYRRFFTVNGLICLNIQNDEVFTHYHQLIKQLLDEGIFQGLRVDHIDGLYDPAKYLKQLRELAGPETYITVEKILEEGETFPANWPVQGNTGYDFLAIVNNVFTQRESADQFTKKYKKLTGRNENIEQSIIEKKAFILSHHMGGELHNLYQLFKSLDLATNKEVAKIDSQLKDAIGLFLIYCPVYRFYGNSMPLGEKEARAVQSIIETAVEDHIQLKPALNLLKKVLLKQLRQGDSIYNSKALQFYQRCMQFTGPLMAKGVEDTLMYTYNRFIGHNEVGDAPDAFGYSVSLFHQLMKERQALWPLSINGTSTHDTKRGEDVRARLNVLTHLPTEWFKLVNDWYTQNAPLKTNNAPDNNDEYFIYQSILGAYPMPDSDDDDFLNRMQDYLIKALREGKQNSDWASPNEAYEEATKKFISALLVGDSNFMKSFKAFQRRIVDYGIINSLSQVLLKFTCPGVPDIYQGCELWDLSLVDPDNRRPVGYEVRDKFLEDKELIYSEQIWKDFWNARYSGQIKLHLTQRLLHLRAADAKVFANAEYIPLETKGKFNSNVLAFARQYSDSWYLTVIPIDIASVGTDGAAPLAFNWEDTAVVLPDTAPRSWQNLFTSAKGYSAGDIKINALFTGLPIAFVKLERPRDRGAGLLLHITSLPSPFGTGDIGPEAYKFVDFLFKIRQRYWQMLPVNPVDRGAGYSPYSANSSMAGNTILISPQLLVDEGWLTEDDIASVDLPSTNRADFDQAVAIKAELFEKAYQRFINAEDAAKYDFELYKTTEAYWLDDYALYQVCKQLNKNKPWYEWPSALKHRDGSALEKVSEKNKVAIDNEKWLQYIFSKQWQQLKLHAEKQGVTLFGDMPFYISYDSVDVWANRELFKLDRHGNVVGVAGVPPDYFSADGQLWGMPVYNWDVLKSTGYNWWLQRVRKNLEYFDLIRLDHFRAFSAYWEVPGGELTAVNGTWMAGPGADFFNVIKRELGQLPFVAEDLGDIDEDVYQLRDMFGLPGMRVLQFAFGADTPASDHIPHNYTADSFAYTGTHDNNTLKGWYKTDAGSAERSTIAKYIGSEVSDKNVCSALIRLCYFSVAKAAILPLQDVLELDGSHRMNIPSSANGNWTWRVTSRQLTEKVSQQLRELTILTNR